MVGGTFYCTMAEGGEPSSAYFEDEDVEHLPDYNPAENLKLKPKKSILKTQPSLDEINALVANAQWVFIS